MKRWLVAVSVVALIGLGVFAQFRLADKNPVETPSVGSGVIASLGGIRSIAVEVIWFRADKLEREGRFGELLQLASMLTFLEPHVPEVWLYSAWNLSYNISSRMPVKKDRWFWVYSAIKMLRDEGLKWNPGDPDICYDLAQTFEIKMGIDFGVGSDSDAAFYREEWRKIVEDVKSRDAWGEIGMDKALMAEVEKLHGVKDWTNPQASAIYWARQGLEKGDKRAKARLNNLIRQAEKLYNKSYEADKS